MKKIKVMALAMALVMLAMCAVACGSEKVSINCTISVVVDGETYLENYAYTVEGNAENPPTVLQAAAEAFQTIDWSYALDENESTFTSITVGGVEYTAGLAEDGSYSYWGYTADGVEPSSGTAGANAILEGQHIVFSFNKTSGQG